MAWAEDAENDGIARGRASASVGDDNVEDAMSGLSGHFPDAGMVTNRICAGVVLQTHDRRANSPNTASSSLTGSRLGLGQRPDFGTGNS